MESTDSTIQDWIRYQSGGKFLVTASIIIRESVENMYKDKLSKGDAARNNIMQYFAKNTGKKKHLARETS
jgi:hypothetical protein